MGNFGHFWTILWRILGHFYWECRIFLWEILGHFYGGILDILWGIVDILDTLWRISDIFWGYLRYIFGKYLTFLWTILDIFIAILDIFMDIYTFQGNLLEFLGERYWYNNRNPIWIYWASEVIPMYVFLKPSHCPDQPRCVRVSQSGPSWAPFHSLTHLLDIFMEKNIFKGNFWTCLGI